MVATKPTDYTARLRTPNHKVTEPVPADPYRNANAMMKFVNMCNVSRSTDPFRCNANRIARAGPWDKVLHCFRRDILVLRSTDQVTDEHISVEQRLVASV